MAETLSAPRDRPAGAGRLGLLAAMVGKELTVMLRYPMEFAAGFVQVFLMVAIFTLSGLTFTTGEPDAAQSRTVAGVMIYGFLVFIFLTETLWSIGYNVRREQKQGTLEQLYLSPASKAVSLISRAVVTLLWTGLLSLVSTLLMAVLIGGLPLANPALGAGLFVLILTGTFGVGFAFAGLTLHLRETSQVLATVIQFTFLVVCSPFYPFSVLPDWLLWVARAIPLSYCVDALRSVLMGLPPGFPELAPLNVEIAVVAAFGVVMPLAGWGLYRWAEERARRSGSLSEY
jgi:ABC-2 type transport system permease protein